jgi:hypothetical protein
VPRAASDSGKGALSTAAGLLEHLRWIFLPLAMAALLAVGVHAAADVLSDQFLTLVDRTDALFDALFSSWSVTAPLVDLVGVEQRTFAARGTALCFELWADVVVALPALGFAEQHAELGRARSLLRRAVARPATLPLTRAPFAAAFALAGSCTVARLVHGTSFATLRHALGPSFAEHVAGAFALVALALVLAAVAWRAILRALEHALDVADAHARTPRQRFARGLVSAVILAPLALAAILRAAPIASLFR